MSNRSEWTETQIRLRVNLPALADALRARGVDPSTALLDGAELSDQGVLSYYEAAAPCAPGVMERPRGERRTVDLGSEWAQ